MGKNDKVKELLLALSNEIKNDRSKKEFVADYLLGKARGEEKKLGIGQFYITCTQDPNNKEIRVEAYSYETLKSVCTLMSISKEGICLYYNVGYFLDLNCDDEGRIHIITEEDK